MVNFNKVLFIATLCGLVLSAAASQPKPSLVFATSYDLSGGRDVGYSGKFVPNTNKYVVTGPSTSTAVTGTDFFALSVNKLTGVRTAGFGNNGLVLVDFDNVGGNSRTDVATELVVLTNPSRIALLGESVVSSVAPTNLTFAIAVVDSTSGALVPSFGVGGKALYDIEKGVNDEIFFGDVDANNDLIVGGFANPGQVSGAGPAFNCALLKINQLGQRVSSFGRNGQVILDYNNGWDDRCRAGIATYTRNGIFESYTVGGRTKPSPIVATSATDNENNWRFSMAAVDGQTGDFIPTLSDNINGFGKFVLNTGNGSFDAIRSVQVGELIFTVGNWGGWDLGISGRKGIAIVAWNAETGPQLGVFMKVNAPVGKSYDIYGMAFDGRNALYVSGGIKADASSAATPQAIVLKFSTRTYTLDTSFGVQGVYTLPTPPGALGAVFRSVSTDGKNALVLSGEAVMTGAVNDVLVARLSV